MPSSQNPITAAQSKWARRVLSKSQAYVANLAAKAGKLISLSRLKAHEAGYLRPTEQFARDLRELYESQGVNFGDFDGDGAPEETPPGQLSRPVVKRCAFLASAELSSDELDALNDTLERSFERLAAVLSQPIERGFFGITEASNEVTQKVFSELALIGATYGTITGRLEVEPQLVVDPETQQQRLANFLAEVRGDKADADEAGEAA